MCFKREGATSTLSGWPLKFVDKFTYLGSNISSTEMDVDIRLAKAWTTIDWLLIIWKSYLSDKIKRDFFSGCFNTTVWMHHMDANKTHRDGNYSRMLQTILNKSWKQYPTKLHLYGNLPPFLKSDPSKRWTKHAGHCWRSKDEVMFFDGLLHMDIPVLTD